MARIIEPDANYDLAMMATALFTLPRPVSSVNTVVILPGQGEWCRLRAGIQARELHHVPRLLVAGHTKTEPEYVVLDVDKLVPFGLLRRDGVVVEAHAWHTAEQSDWLMEQIQKLGITSLALCVSSYHLLRAYLTLLQAFHRHGLKPIPMIPLPVPVSPETISPKNGVSLWDLMPAELARIREYQKKGDVATLATLEAYLDNLWETFPPLSQMQAAVTGV